MFTPRKPITDIQYVIRAVGILIVMFVLSYIFLIK